MKLRSIFTAFACILSASAVEAGVSLSGLSGHARLYSEDGAKFKIRIGYCEYDLVDYRSLAKPFRDYLYKEKMKSLNEKGYEKYKIKIEMFYALKNARVFDFDAKRTAKLDCDDDKSLSYMAMVSLVYEGKNKLALAWYQNGYKINKKGQVIFTGENWAASDELARDWLTPREARQLRNAATQIAIEILKALVGKKPG